MKIVWTDSAKTDLIDIRDFLRSSESVQFAAKVTKEIRDEVATLKKWPKHKGTYVKELEELNLPQYRQLLAGQHRIIFERGDNETCYIHLVCHTSRDLETMLRRRLLGS
ncbi:type II toxin-antitoxin system RelE/ParE family toxin [Duganella sp. BJB1802]|uniref:Type II toxin-antitoxin system RelE/ParE family toxin n=1 Tax=Duganella vulcania TaxID=2692166 RepID=A0A845G6Y7_9BURK|nr:MULTISPECIES: type II toxin-antitoxin system RelE/ParE family toxin [Duganella]MYM89631.1 type II toxin-antitoxin system RelE/ParE family toxin [Duganella vulcania]NVD71100.1 type II toxin-antitoxin system RelE/ParE family toxin [Duganella sp. BJB1802]